MKAANGELGRKIRDARMAKGISQGQLAKACGLKTSQVSQLETGKATRFVSAKVGARMARRLGLHPLDLLKLGAPDYAVWERAFATT